MLNVRRLFDGPRLLRLELTTIEFGSSSGIAPYPPSRYRSGTDGRPASHST